MSLRVLITSRSEKIFDGTCSSVTSHNDVGEFDVLENHANFITIIDKYVVIDKGGDNELKTNIDNGVLNCADNSVAIFVQL